MHIVIFGATGRTGAIIVERALQQGHLVTAFVRDPHKVTVQANNLRVAIGDVLDRATIDKALEGQEAVLCALGTGFDLRPTTLLSEGTKNITVAMEQRNVKRLVCVLSGWLFFDTVPAMFQDITKEHERQLAVLKQSSLEWLAVCPPQITDNPPTGKYRIAVDTLPENGTQVSKADIADFSLMQLSGNDYLYKAVGIAD